MNLTKGQIMMIHNMVNTELSNKNTVYNPTELVNLKEQLLLYGVGSSLPKVCKGCGTLSTKVIDKKYLACCPDNNYIDMEDYCKNSIYPEKQF